MPSINLDHGPAQRPPVADNAIGDRDPVFRSLADPRQRRLAVPQHQRSQVDAVGAQKVESHVGQKVAAKCGGENTGRTSGSDMKGGPDPSDGRNAGSHSKGPRSKRSAPQRGYLAERSGASVQKSEGLASARSARRFSCGQPAN
jgi:hypothetical protein